MRRLLLLGTATLALAPAARDLQAQTQAAAGTVRPAVSAAATAAPPRIDGRLDEAAWAAAPPITGFVQGEPIEGAPAGEQTEVRVLFDQGAIYVAARMFDGDPAGIARQLVRRDEWGQYDSFEVMLDPNGDRRTGYSFRVSAAGVQGDAYLFDDTRDDNSWNAVWESAVQIDDRGWTAEIRIPLSQIRYEPSAGDQTWGVNFARRRLASNEVSYLALLSRQVHGRVSAFATMDGLALHESPQRMEFRPYLLGGARTAPARPGDPFFDGSSFTRNAGVDIRYGLGTAFALDLTLNPDFGQVEVDPAVINLSAFETFYDERRPFFVEDARVFDFRLSGQQNALFYSRRVGRAPQGSATGGASFTDVPDQSTILAAAKVTGKTAGGLSLGVFSTVTETEYGRAFLPDGGGRIERFLAEPRTAAGVVRLQQDLRGGASTVGAIVTGLHRTLPDDRTFDFLPSEAFSAGVDFEHSWAERSWALWGFLAGTSVQGSSEAMVRLQRSSNHYYQRPDAYQLAVDSAATSMTGAEWRLQLDRRSGRNWTGGVWLAQRTAGFDANDLGFFRGSERLDGGVRVSYQEINPGRVFRNYRINAFTFQNWRHEALREPFSYDSWGRAHKAGTFSGDANLTFLNYWGLNFNARYNPEVLADGATRGGPLMTAPASAGFGLRGNTDRRRRINFEPGFNYNRSALDAASGYGIDLEISLRPSPRWELELEPGYERQRDNAQYVTAAAAPGFAPTYGRRYVFADLERRSFSLETRLNYTFTPTLTLQLFAQPLLSAGEYRALKLLARSESFEFDRLAPGTAVVAGSAVTCAGGRVCAANGRRHLDFDGNGTSDLNVAEPDFNIRSLRGNAVLRWEYRPGSTLFVVWQQSRFQRGVDADEWSIGRGASNLFDAPPENLFMVKLNYWLGL